ncbi:hypothetical protein PENTCL1PPCAC_5194, partial [Pristionchus entomophagus]
RRPCCCRQRSFFTSASIPLKSVFSLSSPAGCTPGTISTASGLHISLSGACVCTCGTSRRRSGCCDSS